MIGSHDSFTFLKSTNFIYNLSSKFWRCQNKSIVEQYTDGVRMFDVRIIRDNNKWRAAHGVVKLKQTFNTIEDIARGFKLEFPEAVIRIWYEHGSDKDFDIFMDEIVPLIDKYPNIVQVVRKTPETVLYVSEDYPKMLFYTYSDWSAKGVVSNVFKDPIRDYAKQYKPTIYQEMIDDPGVCYFMDYV